MPGAARLEVGRIGRAHGLRGEISVTLSSDRSERLAPGSVLTTDDHSPAAQALYQPTDPDAATLTSAFQLCSRTIATGPGA